MRGYSSEYFTDIRFQAFTMGVEYVMVFFEFLSGVCSTSVGYIFICARNRKVSATLLQRVVVYECMVLTGLF
jgi:hypothetical protein